jgi:hypothetical protein
MNTVNLTLANSESGIREVRYEYLTKFADSGIIENYYGGISDFDVSYMQGKAKKAKVESNLTTIINAPKNVQSIKVAVIDKAGNVNLYNQQIAPDLYIGYTLDSRTTENTQVTANIYSTNGVKSISFSQSTDGIYFSNEQTYTLDTTTNGITNKQCLPFTNMTSSVIYIKMTAVNYDSTITETRTVMINLTGSIVLADLGYNRPVLANGMIPKKWNGTSWVTVASPDTDTWYNYANKEWANAQTADGSMWVWIPRYIYKISSLWHVSSTLGGAINVQFSKGTDDDWNSAVIGNINTAAGASASNNTWTNHPAFTFRRCRTYRNMGS